MRLCLGEQGSSGGRVGHVGLHGEHARAEFGGQRFGGLTAAAVVDDNLGALARESTHQ